MKDLQNCKEVESIMIQLKVINEDNFLDAFQLRLADGQEKYVSNPIRSLAQAYVYRKQCQPFGDSNRAMVVSKKNAILQKPEAAVQL